jgi:putative iron-only hydrogenase system regulator
MLKEKRIGTTLIVIESKEEIHRLNTLISEFSYLIIGRQGIPLRENNKSIISLVLEGEEDQIGAFSGQIGRLNGIIVKTALVRRS